MNRLNLVWLLLAITGLTVACGGAQPAPVELTIEMTEYAYSPENIELQVGQEVTIHLVNKGQLEHEITFGREVMSMDNQPSGYQIDMFEIAGVEPVVEIGESSEDHMEEEEHGHTGFMVSVPGGDHDHDATLRFTVTKEMVGEWEIGCFLQEGVHYTAGMRGRLVVKP